MAFAETTDSEKLAVLQKLFFEELRQELKFSDKKENDLIEVIKKSDQNKLNARNKSQVILKRLQDAESKDYPKLSQEYDDSIKSLTKNDDLMIKSLRKILNPTEYGEFLLARKKVYDKFRATLNIPLHD